MKRLLPVGILMAAVMAGYFVGRLTSPAVLAAPQAATPALPPPNTLYWPQETLMNMHKQLAARVAKGLRPNGNDLIVLPTGWKLNHRYPGDMPSAPAGNLAEMHESGCHFFVGIAGSGTVGVGGEIENPRPLLDAKGNPVPGEIRGWPVKNGTIYKFKAGDFIYLPPHSAHWAAGDPGGLTYLLINISDGSQCPPNPPSAGN